MRKLTNVITQIEECLKGTKFLEEKQERISKLKRDCVYQPPESFLYWNKFGIEIIEEIGDIAELTGDETMIKALAIWGNTTVDEIHKIIENRKNLKK